MYQIKEAFYTLQGEGAQTGMPSVFCRFVGCNLWSGREQDRAGALCTFCDTDFLGTDGSGGGKFRTADELAEHLLALWPADAGHRHVVCTGGEPLLQLDEPLIQALHARGFRISVETNGTRPAPAGIDWLCLSPKGRARPVITDCNELKLVFPQADALPQDFTHIRADYRYLSPMNAPDGSIATTSDATRQAVAWCLAHPEWRLTLQSHKLLGID